MSMAGSETPAFLEDAPSNASLTRRHKKREPTSSTIWNNPPKTKYDNGIRPLMSKSVVSETNAVTDKKYITMDAEPATKHLMSSL
jgi:hypothetical protein